MAKRVIKCKIDVKKLDKRKMYVGEKGIYANITLIETPGGKMGDWMIVEDTSKEEQDAGNKGVILGNGKNKGGWGDSSSSSGSSKVSVEDLPY
jgi:hypothetical protein